MYLFIFIRENIGKIMILTKKLPQFWQRTPALLVNSQLPEIGHRVKF